MMLTSKAAEELDKGEGGSDEGEDDVERGGVVDGGGDVLGEDEVGIVGVEEEKAELIDDPAEEDGEYGNRIIFTGNLSLHQIVIAAKCFPILFYFSLHYCLPQ